MKKTIYLIAIAITLSIASFAQTPIAVKNLDADTVTGLNQRVAVWQFTADSKSEKIVVVYTIQILSPNGRVVLESNPMTYERIDRAAILDGEGNVITPASMKFTELRQSSIGIAITDMIQTTINGYPNLEQ